MTDPPTASGSSAASVSTDAAVARWEAAGRRIDACGHRVWVADLAGRVDVGNPPLLVLHGFPTCSFDWSAVIEDLRSERRVVLLDFLGFGLSDKPDQRYSMRGQADVVEAVVAHLGLERVDLLTHDMGDSIGGEILARSLEGHLGFEVARRVLANGSIYIEMAQLTAGQQLLLSLPDARLVGLGDDGGAAFRGGVAATFAPDSPVDDLEMHVLSAMALRSGGIELLPRTIRYIEDRREEEARYTGAIEAHPSPLGVVWGTLDPVAVVAMAERLQAARPDTTLVTLDDVGHYPMIEAPDRFAATVIDLLQGAH